jgi:hypothetical protein
MTRQITIRGFRISKTGRIEPDPKRLSVSKQLQIKSSKRIRPARRGESRP